MAKNIQLKILVEGGKNANKEVKEVTNALVSIRGELQKQTKTRQELNKRLKEGTISQSEYNKRIAAAELKTKALRSEYGKTQKQLLALNGVTNKGSSFTDKLTKSFVKAGAAIGAAILLYNKVENSIVSSVEAYNQAIQAEGELLRALQGRRGVQFSLIQQAKALQKTTIFGNDEIVRAQAVVAAFVKEEETIKRLTPAILDFAQAKGVDLKTAADLITKTFASSTNALSRYGLEVTGAAGSTERLESLTSALDSAFKGAAETAGATSTGQFKQLDNAIGDLSGSFGKLITSLVGEGGRSLIPVVEFLQDALEGLGFGFAAVKGVLSGDLQGSLQAYINSTVLATDAVGNLSESESDAIDGKKELNEQLKQQAKNLDEIIKKIREEGQATKELQEAEDEQAREIIESLENESEVRSIVTDEQLEQIDTVLQAQLDAREQDNLDRLEKNKQREKDEEEAEIRRKARNQQIAQESLAAAQSVANSIQQITQNRTDNEIFLENQKVDKSISALERQLKQGIINQSEYNARVASEERIRDNEIKKLKLKQFKRDKAFALISIALSTAQAVAAALAVPPPPNFILAGLAAGAGLAQTIAVKTQKPNFASGGFTGKGTGSKDHTGQRPVGTVHENEWVANRHLVSNPATAPIISMLENIQRNGFAQGGFTTPVLNTVSRQQPSQFLQNQISNSVQKIKVVNVVSDTTSQQNKLSNIQSQATF